MALEDLKYVTSLELYSTWSLYPPGTQE